MSLMRQLEPLVRSYAVSHPPGEVRLPTQRGWQVVLLSSGGVLHAVDERARWTVPPGRALFIGDGRPIRVRTPHRASVRCLYLDRSLDVLEPDVRVIDTTPLDRELLLHAVEVAPFDLDQPVRRALMTLLADRLATSPTAPLRLPQPYDDRARDVADRIVASPASPLVAVVDRVPASRRTLERHFRAETAMTLGGWQRRARALAAVELMAEGHSVTHAAVAVGYATPSSFVAAFRAELGASPAAFMRARGG
jgi:AraC-like DNA-binding protein